jgi:hypothetical protein
MASRVVAAGGSALLAKSNDRHCVPLTASGVAMAAFIFMNGSGGTLESEA